jgi:hypothetical protein
MSGARVFEVIEGRARLFGGTSPAIVAVDGRVTFADTLVGNRIRDCIGRRMRITVEELPAEPPGPAAPESEEPADAEPPTAIVDLFAALKKSLRKPESEEP